MDADLRINGEDKGRTKVIGVCVLRIRGRDNAYERRQQVANPTWLFQFMFR